jgi:hypothetical protein
MVKTIVTHINPDLDAMTAVWLLKRFGPEFKDAPVKFIYAGSTYQDKPVDSDAEVVHVDTGWGKFDHHQTNERTCAARLILQWLGLKDEALERMVEVVTQVDWGAEDLRYPDAGADKYAFLFNERKIISGWQKRYPGQSDKHLEWGLAVLDGVYENLKNKLEAQLVIEKQGRAFATRWGQGLAAVTNVFGFMPLAQAQGYAVVVVKDPKKGHVRIHGLDQAGKEAVDFTGAAEQLRIKDAQATWFLHASKKLLLNGSTVNPKMIPTSLNLDAVVEVLEHA